MKSVHLLLLLCFSCSMAPTQSREKPTISIVRNDHSSGLSYSADYEGDPRMIYVESIKSRRINSDALFSCYKDSVSVNYVNFPETIVSQLRLYASDAQFQIAHKSSVTRKGDVFREISAESKQVKLNIRRRICFKEIDGVVLKVISEIYEKEIQ